MFLLFVRPGFQQASPDTLYLPRKNELDQQAVAKVAANQQLFNNPAFSANDRMALADAARRNDRAAFDGIMNNVAPSTSGNARDVLFANLRGNVLVEQQILYREEFAASNDSYAASFWVGASIKNARDYAPYSPGMVPGTHLTEQECVSLALEALGNQSTTLAQKEEMLMSAIERGAPAASVFSAARNLGIDQSTSTEGFGTVMQRLYKAARDRADALFKEMRAHYNPSGSGSSMEYFHALNGFKDLLGDNAIPDQTILAASDDERRDFMDAIHARLKSQAGIP